MLISNMQQWSHAWDSFCPPPYRTLPDDLERFAERLTHLVPKRLSKRRDRRNRRKGELDTLCLVRIAQGRMSAVFLQVVLQDLTADNDP